MEWRVPRLVRPTLLFTLTALVAAFAAGCLYVPLSEKKVLKGEQVTEEQRQAIHLGVTTKNDVLAALGPPAIEWENERVFAYRWEVRQGVLLYAVAAGYKGDAGIIDIPKGYLLLVQFDEADRVRRVERVVDRAFKSFGEQVRQWAEAPAPAPASADRASPP
jgi:outer membrane protein assembly factor BamE (lipoprotein component of BamABCDE complex)